MRSSQGSVLDEFYLGCLLALPRQLTLDDSLALSAAWRRCEGVKKWDLCVDNFSSLAAATPLMKALEECDCLSELHLDSDDRDNEDTLLSLTVRAEICDHFLAAAASQRLRPLMSLTSTICLKTPLASLAR